MRTLYFLVVLLLGLCWLLARGVAAQPEQDVVTQLTIVAYAESVHDRAGIWGVLRKRASWAQTTPEVLAHRYVSVFKAAVDGQPRTKWLRHITSDCTRPEGLPASETWSTIQCQQVRADAEAFLRNELHNPCKDADNWGARDLEEDVKRAQRAISAGRWEEIPCDQPMSNAFYRTIR